MEEKKKGEEFMLDGLVDTIIYMHEQGLTKEQIREVVDNYKYPIKWEYADGEKNPNQIPNLPAPK